MQNPLISQSFLARPSRLAVLSALVPLVLGLALWGAIPTEDYPYYFEFVENRTWAGIPHVGDVLSNLPFLAVGAAGWFWSAQAGALRWLVRALATACFLTGIGSSYFHWAPSVFTLFWDRLPMVVLFSSLIGLIVGDRVSPRSGEWTAAILTALSAFHLVLWKEGHSDLRPYFLYQAGAFFWLLMFMSLSRGVRVSNGRIGAMLGLYFLAKVLEARDLFVYEAVEVVSGHTMKHLVAAVAVFCVFLAFRRLGDQRSL